MGERLQNLWMKVTRGDIPSRFEKIRRTFLEVSRDSAEQLQRESRVLEMYGDFRLSIKDAEIQAHELLKLQEQALADAREALRRRGLGQVEGEVEETARLRIVGRRLLAAAVIVDAFDDS